MWFYFLDLIHYEIHHSKVLGLPPLLYSVMGFLNTIAGVYEFLSAESAFEGALNCVSWENLLKKASLLNSNGSHNKAIGLAVAAQGNLTEPVKDKGLLLFLDFLKLFGSLATTMRVKDKNKWEFQTSTALQTDLHTHIVYQLVSQLPLLV